MRTRALIVLCVVMTFGVVQAVANGHQEDGPASPAASTPMFLPLVAKQENVDLTITRLDVSQAIQTPQQSVPFVANRPTIVRAYLQAIAPQAMNGVTISFVATRLGVPIAGSPLIVEPVTAPLAPAQGEYASTVNVSLPGAWLSGNVTLTVTVDPSGAIGETNEMNNQRSTTLVFNNVPALELKIVPVNYTHTPTGKYFPAVFTDPVSDFVRRTYPLSGINLTYRVPISFAGDLSQASGWSQLLNQITSVKFADGATGSQVYYGLVPTRDMYGAYFYPNIIGIAWIGLRAAAGMDFDPTVGAHEIGHTFDRLHAPCGGPDWVDPYYPYAGASIGNYGIDVYSNVLVNPSYTKDLMSYCSPQWVSDYTYEGLYDDQRANSLAGFQAAPAQVLLIRARFDSPQAAELLPVYSLGGFPDETPADSEYAVELIGWEGEVIATYPVRRYETSDLNPPTFAIYAALPQPAQPISKIRLMHFEDVLAERLMSDRVPMQATMQTLDFSDHAIALAWDGAYVPALVRYSTGSGNQWVTLGLDVLGGRLSIDRSMLPGGELHFEVIPADASAPIWHTLDLPSGVN